MAGAPRTFIFPKAASIQSKNPEVREKEDKGNQVYLRSASKEVVEHLLNIKCKKCETSGAPVERQRFSAGNYPRITPCGHYIHRECHDPTRPYLCAPSTDCRRAHDVYTRDFTCAVTDELALKDILVALEKNKGYECMSCLSYHPANNSVRVTHDRDGNVCDPDDYACVWCAADPVQLRNFKVRLIDPLVDKDSSLPVGSFLSSLDRTSREAGSGFLQCCSCAKKLEISEPPYIAGWGLENRYCLEHLYCGHIRHERCSLIKEEKHGVLLATCQEHFRVETIPDSHISILSRPPLARRRDRRLSLYYLSCIDLCTTAICARRRANSPRKM